MSVKLFAEQHFATSCAPGVEYDIVLKAGGPLHWSRSSNIVKHHDGSLMEPDESHHFNEPVWCISPNAVVFDIVYPEVEIPETIELPESVNGQPET